MISLICLVLFAIIAMLSIGNNKKTLLFLVLFYCLYCLLVADYSAIINTYLLTGQL